MGLASTLKPEAPTFVALDNLPSDIIDKLMLDSMEEKTIINMTPEEVLIDTETAQYNNQ